MPKEPVIEPDDGTATHRCRIQEYASDYVYKCTDKRPSDLLLSTGFNCASANCKVCLDLNWDYFPFSGCVFDKAPFTFKSFDFENRTITTHVHHLEATQKSCDSCKVIIQAIKQSYDWLLAYDGPETCYASFIVQIILQPGFTVLVAASDQVSINFPRIELFTEAGKPSTWKALGNAPRHSHLPPTFPTCVDFIKEHLDLCYEHPACEQPVRELPTRIVDVSILRKPRLVTSQGKRARYLTLSHCWGNQDYKPLVTTKESLDAHHSEIPWASLSSTFQHAMIISHKVGCRYLWIDSLCIVQDDPSDWAIESTKMAEIYMNSELTISAVSAKDGRGGCIVPRPMQPPDQHLFPQNDTEQTLEPKIENILCRAPPSDSHRIAEVLPLLTDDYDGELEGVVRNEESPLIKRAWVFQESVLCRRNVLFNSQEMIWECRHSLNCECGYLRWLQNRRADLVRDHPLLDTPSPGWKSPFTTLETTTDPKLEAMTDEWYKLVLAYSALHITYQTDRLPALSGLASEFSKKLKTKYLAGLWESDLWRGLLWLRPEFYNRKTRCARLTGEASSIPSWSWASIIHDHHENAPIYVFASSRVNIKKDDRFTTISANCTTTTENIFGHVSGGTLKIRGALLTIRLYSRGYWDDMKTCEVFLCDQHEQIITTEQSYPAYNHGAERFDMVFDVGHGGAPKEVSRLETIYCLCVAGSLLGRLKDGEKEEVYARWCLVLKLVDFDNTFQRVGVFNYTPFGLEYNRDGELKHGHRPRTDWFKDAPIEVVNIF